MTIRCRSFTLTDATGAPCVQWQEMGETGFTLTVKGSQTFRESTSGFNIDVTCPDGTKFHNGNALNLLSCDTGLFGLPGEAVRVERYLGEPTSLESGSRAVRPRAELRLRKLAF